MHSCAAICLVQHYTRLRANTMQYTAKLCLYQFSSERTVHSAAAIWRARQCTRLSSGNWRLSPPPVSSTLHTAPASRPPDRSFPAIFLTSRFSIHSPQYFCRLELLDFSTCTIFFTSVYIPCMLRRQKLLKPIYVCCWSWTWEQPHYMEIHIPQNCPTWLNAEIQIPNDGSATHHMAVLHLQFGYTCNW